MNDVKGLNIFGSLTIKTVQIDKTDGTDGKNQNIDGSDIDYLSLLDDKNFDILDLSSMDKDADTKVTEADMVLWEQEARMKLTVDTLKGQVIKDFANEDPEDIISVLEKINEFKNEFEKTYLKENDAATLSAAFEEALPEEYEKIKKEAMKNTKGAIKERVVENLLEELIKDAENGGRSLLGIVSADAIGVPDETKQAITKELTKEANKYAKNYKGSNFEEDLMKHLREFMAETDREKLSGAVQQWDEDKNKVEDETDKNGLRQLKEIAKSFLTSAYVMGVDIEIGGITIRTEAGITQALNMFNDAKALKTAVDSSISQLSTLSREERLLGRRDTSTSFTPQFTFTPQTNATNFFKL